MDKKKIAEELVIVFWLFVVGSILGYVFETLLILFLHGNLESRQGLLYGPFTPVYGVGAVVYYLIINNLKEKSNLKVFLITMLLGGITEFLFSFFQEKAFGTISWDYSGYPLNFDGRTSLFHCACWGIVGILYFILIEPVIERYRAQSNKNSVRAITTLATVFMVFDISISCIVAGRQAERKKNIAPKNEFEIFIDEHYPDEYVDKIFSNKIEVS